MTTLLAGDIGGTKTLLALYKHQPASGDAGERVASSRLALLHSERYASADWIDLAPMLQHFLAATGHGGGAQEQPLPAAACLAVAGPVEYGQASLTNLSWQLSETQLAQACGIQALELVNDFAVLPYGLPHLQPDQQALIHPGKPCLDAPRLVLGAGTGLGVAYGLPSATGWIAMASEAGHGEFAPRSAAEWELKQWLAADLRLERLSIERVVSGTGLGHVARWLLARHPTNGKHSLQTITAADLPAAVAAAAAGGDPLAQEALDLWLGAYGSVCGDLALAGLSRGGIWLAGGTAAKLIDGLRGSSFRTAMLNKGRLQGVLEAIPVQAVVDPNIGPFSAACRAAMLVA